ncbi:putative MYH7B protein [Trypanosoma grayi]|uniref:putative MYH7B protein n=1 Tax=Trypanosoma grayi TaxID=71804 RepID=UPI0004F4A5F5|nr:putative MYH7B protein [Trypanosoma grayi]KEG07995.1 putative MYH7B protein [Trypanosoma grayi]
MKRNAYASLAHTVGRVPSTTDLESALLEANMLPLRTLCLLTRLSIFEKLTTCTPDWIQRPPPEPQPHFCFRISPISCHQLHSLTGTCRKNYDITELTPRKRSLFRNSITPLSAAPAQMVSFGVGLLLDRSITGTEGLIREKKSIKSTSS